METFSLVSSLQTIAFAKKAKRRRASSYDKSGGNDDRIYIAPGDSAVVANIEGCGCITHIWCTMAGENFVEEPNYLRKIVLRMFWDGETQPSVEVPIGDFFGMGHAQCKNYVSAPLQMSPQDGKALNCWFPMPFAAGARIEVLNECAKQAIFYYYVDYELWDALPEDTLRFHAVWHRECPTKGISPEGMSNVAWEFDGKNTTGEQNYVLLKAEGRGHYVGCNVNIHNLHNSSAWDWYGEGDDMIV